tara:strand:- start:34278 stop:35165 length:888 start_codon:yes stop_codon:yes gene_type:complete
MKIKHKLNSKKLKKDIEKLYLRSLLTEDPIFINYLDSIKSIIGMDLDSINYSLIKLFEKQIENKNQKLIEIEQKEKIPEAISIFSLERSLNERNKQKALDNIFYLSRVSDGMQILEFLLEFSLKNCANSHTYIWYIIRMQKFLNGKFILESLNKIIDIIFSDQRIELKFDKKNNIEWSKILSKKYNSIDDILLYYTIYKSDLIRGIGIKKVISCRLFEISENSHISKDNTKKIYDEQILLGRKWIANNIRKIHDSKLSLETIRFFDLVRSCLMLSSNNEENELIWSYLNNRYAVK